MFLGTFEVILNEKNRVALPAKLRRELKARELVLSIGFEKCILGFEERKWAEVTAADLSRPLSDVGGRDLRRKLCMNAQMIELDANGRFVVPELMISYAGVKKEAVLIGAGDHFEIWDKKVWKEYQLKLESGNGQ
jgi:MraZ protein